MRRRILLFGPILLLSGCKEPTPVSRVELPAGLKKVSTGMAKAPAAAKPLTPVGQELIGSPPARPVDKMSGLTASADHSAPAIDAVCRYDEQGLECWDPHGIVKTGLKLQVRNLISASKASVPVAIGSTNRIVMTLIPKTDSVRQMSVITDGTLVQSIPVQNALEGDRERHLYHLSAEPTRPTASLRFLKSVRRPQEVPISLTKGATATVAGLKVKVASIEKWDGLLDGARMPMVYPGWKIVLRVVGKIPSSLKLFPVDPTPFVLADGRHVSREEMFSGKMTLKRMTSYSMKSLIFSSLPKGALAIVIDRDPRTVKKISIGASDETIIELTDIPLNPK